MKVKKTDSLKYKLEQRIKNLPDVVIFRSDIADLSDEHQLSRALRELVKENKIAKISYGIYAKLKQSEFLDRPILAKNLDEIAKKIFERLNIKWDLTTAQKDYNMGKATQVPVRISFRLKNRFRRKINYEGYKVYYEGNIYAK